MLLGRGLRAWSGLFAKIHPLLSCKFSFGQVWVSRLPTYRPSLGLGVSWRSFAPIAWHLGSHAVEQRRDTCSQPALAVVLLSRHSNNSSQVLSTSDSTGDNSSRDYKSGLPSSFPRETSVIRSFPVQTQSRKFSVSRHVTNSAKLL